MRWSLKASSLALVTIAFTLGACQGNSDQDGDASTPNGYGPDGFTDNGPVSRQRLPLPDGAVMLQRVAITDPGIIAPGTAMTALVPEGWTTSGGVVPQRGPCNEPYGVNWSATSPDGASVISIFPTEVWQASNTSVRSDCQPGSYSSAREYLTARVQRAFADAQIVEYRDRADFAQSAKDMVSRSTQMAQQYGLNLRGKAEGGEVLFEYTHNGTAMRGVVGVTAVFYLTQVYNPMGGPPLTSLTGATLGSFTATAPRDQLNMDLVEASRRSITPNAEWLNALFSLQNQLGDIAVQGTRERAAIIVAGGAAATKANIESFQIVSGANRAGSGSGGSGSGELYPGDAAGDRMQRENIEAIRGVETYHDPVSNSNVQLDHSYGNAWRVNNQDAYILTKDPNFNPGQYGINATQLKVVK